MLSKLISPASLWALPFEGEGWTNSGVPLHSKMLPAMTWVPPFLFPRIVWLIVPSSLFWYNCGLITVYPMLSHRQGSSGPCFHYSCEKRQTLMMHFPGIHCAELLRQLVYKTRHKRSLNEDVIRENCFLSRHCRLFMCLYLLLDMTLWILSSIYDSD